MTDIRFKRIHFPMTFTQNGISDVRLVEEQSMKDECLSDACNGVTCINPALCADVFRTAICV